VMTIGDSLLDGDPNGAMSIFVMVHLTIMVDFLFFFLNLNIFIILVNKIVMLL
jgi:hypothetical protein